MNDPLLNYYNLTPKSNLGSSFDYKPKESTKVGIGTEYQYDQQNKNESLLKYSLKSLLDFERNKQPHVYSRSDKGFTIIIQFRAIVQILAIFISIYL